jgi:hypothetical protein
MKDWQKRMTSLSDLALGVEVGAALAAAHGEGGEGVLEDLLEAEELEDAQVDGGVEAEAALVGADGAVELDAETAVDLDLAGVVLPGHAEDDLAFGFDDAFEDAFEDFAGGLEEFRFAGVAGLHLGQDFLDVAHRGDLSGVGSGREAGPSAR